MKLKVMCRKHLGKTQPTDEEYITWLEEGMFDTCKALHNVMHTKNNPAIAENANTVATKLLKKLGWGI